MVFVSFFKVPESLNCFISKDRFTLMHISFVSWVKFQSITQFLLVL